MLVTEELFIVTNQTLEIFKNQEIIAINVDGVAGTAIN